MKKIFCEEFKGSRGPFGDPTIQILEKHEEEKKKNPKCFLRGWELSGFGLRGTRPIGSSQEACVKGYGQAKAIEGGPQPSYLPTLSV